MREIVQWCVSLPQDAWWLETLKGRGKLDLVVFLRKKFKNFIWLKLIFIIYISLIDHSKKIIHFSSWYVWQKLDIVIFWEKNIFFAHNYFLLTADPFFNFNKIFCALLRGTTHARLVDFDKHSIETTITTPVHSPCT